MFADHLLSLCIWLPIVGGIVVLATGNDGRAPLARQLALAFSILTFLATIPLIVQFAGCASSPAQTGAQSARTVVQFEEKKSYFLQKRVEKRMAYAVTRVSSFP